MMGICNNLWRMPWRRHVLYASHIYVMRFLFFAPRSACTYLQSMSLTSVSMTQVLVLYNGYKDKEGTDARLQISH